MVCAKWKVAGRCLFWHAMKARRRRRVWLTVEGDGRGDTGWGLKVCSF